VSFASAIASASVFASAGEVVSVPPPLPLLLDAPEYARVHALSRRPLPLDHPRLANRIVRFDALQSQLKGVTCQDAFCCLGTTLREAGTEEVFREVDQDLVLRFAHAAAAAGAERFIFISAVGARVDARSLYLRVKGETERALEMLRFRALDILQPGLLLGSRREWRPLEAAAQLVMPAINPLLQGRFRSWRAVDARTVAAAMCGTARGGRRGVYRYTYAGLRALAAAGRA